MRTGGRLRRRAALIGSVWALTCVSVRPSSAEVADYLGRTVIDVRFELEGADVRDAALASLLQVRVGQPLNLAAVRETLGHLFTLGRYEDIQVRASLEGGGVAVVFDLVPLHRVQALEFRGPLVLDPPLLRATIADRLGPTPAVGRAGDAAAILEDLHRDHGYRHATVIARSRIDHRPDRTTLIFDVMPGAPTRVGTVTVEGERVAPAAVLEALDLGRNAVFRQVDLDQALARYRGELQDRGYYEARANYLPRFSADELTVDLTIVVDTGPLVRLRFEGDPLPEDERATLVPIARERSADEDLLEDAKRRIENRLQALGYRDALAEYRRDQFGDVLTIVFTITRGPLHRLERLEIVGSSMAPELQALVRQREGEPFVESILAADVAGMLALYLRRGFAGVAIDTMVSSTEGVDARSRLVTATISVTEGERTFIGRVTFEGNTGIGEPTLRIAAGLAAGQPFYEPETNLAADALVIAYADRGYQNATVQRTIAYSEDRGTVDVAFRISEGVQVIVDQILIAGNTRADLPARRSAGTERDRRESAPAGRPGPLPPHSDHARSPSRRGRAAGRARHDRRSAGDDDRRRGRA
jgi:outer membrane protein assembly factor BamA